MKKIMIFLAAVLLFATMAYADGMHLSDYVIHLYEPSQKAVISWDGQTEKIVLASAVKSENISNFAWVVPIQSYTKPEVTAGNMSLFRDLIDYFSKRNDNYGLKTAREQSISGVEVVESKEIDIYDVAILKATSADDLISWLNGNGYKVPEDAKPIFDKYVAKGDYYFIANKIDLKNKYEEAMAFVESFNEGNENYADERAMLNFNSFYFPSSIAAYIVANVNYSLVRQDDISFISRGEYEQLREKYGVNVDERFASLSEGVPFFQLVGRIGNCDNAECVGYLNFNCRNDISSPYTLVYEVNETWAESSRWVVFLGDCSEVTDVFGSLDEAKQAISEIPFDKIFENINTVKPKLNNIAEEQNSKILPMRDKLIEMSDTKFSLKRGLATPLKFEFQPHQPYYPLEISSLNRGDTLIDVYVIADMPMSDKNSILKLDEAKKINPDLKSKLQMNGMYPSTAEYVTRLSYAGQLSGLNADSEFKPEKPTSEIVTPVYKEGIFIRILRWIVVTVGRVF